MLDRIMEMLGEIERRENVHIVYVCESGSRAWGFPSEDSDYDVRFIYVRPHDWYLSIDVERRRDVIEEPIVDELDVNGWDIRKALQLLAKSNPPLMEWLDSPIVYLERTPIAAMLREAVATFYSPKACFYHYYTIARNTTESKLRSEMVRHKSYFYALRPLLACRWIEADLGVVPIEFGTLVERVVDDAELREEIDRLLAWKRAGGEKDLGPGIPAISSFIERELARLGPVGEGISPTKATIDRLNDLFREAVRIVGDEGTA